MKKFFKIFFISLGSLVLLLAIIISIALWVVFTPERLTPIVNKQVPKFITCQADIGKVELTFFSTFPNFVLKIDEVALFNPLDNSACDKTLLDVKQLEAKVDIKSLVKNDELLLSDIRLTDGMICAHIDSLGNTNFDIFPVDTISAETTVFELPFALIDVSQIELKNIHVSYIDEESGMEAGLTNLSGKINASVKSLDNIDAEMNLSPFDITFVDYASDMKADIRSMSAKIKASIREDDVHADLVLSPSQVSIDMEGEKYLENANIEIKTITHIALSRQQAHFSELTASVNGMEISLQGTVENDTVNNNIVTDISYSLQSWSLTDLIALIPSSFEHYLEGINVTGKISSSGNISGVYNDTTMPLLDIHFLLEDGTVVYSGLPFPLHGVSGDLNIYTDLDNDAISYVNVNNFKASTPGSTIRTAGKVNRLFSDPHVNLTTTANLNLAEFNSIVPEDMKVDMKGRVAGNIKTDLSLSQVENLALEKMKVSGSLSLNDLNILYDSISLKSRYSKIDFELPNRNAATRNTTFVSANIISDYLEADMIDAFAASLENMQIALETSDVRDTTSIPAVNLMFSSRSLKAETDSMNVAIENPQVSVSVAPQRRNADQPRFNVKVNTGNLAANINEEVVKVEKQI